MYCQTNEIQIKSILDSTDIEVLLGKKKIRMFELMGSPVDSSSQSKKSKYIFNYLVQSVLLINNAKFIKLLIPLLTCKPPLSQIPKCTFLVKYCVEIQNDKGRLYLFFSENSDCQDILKVIKVNTINHKESHDFFDIKQFAGLL
jgi:hypothetical protein